MDEQAWLLTKEIFQRALECAPEDRAGMLDAACADKPEVRAQVEALLEGHAEVEPGTSAGVAAPPDSGHNGEGPGTVIDRYKLLEKIGEGGFGVVYMAQQTEPVRRKVALKIIKLGMDTKQVIARFEAERQALAMMDHPNIARVFDAGATNTGRPYFVMELVKGISITEYCDQAMLSTEERLQLFTSVCRAVQYAHMKGVIHRDLKPSNLLVTLHDGEPVVKVIDFGIAKATGQALTDKTLFTAFRQILGTPAYMAPEQAEMSGLDVDTRADVYSLGVLLYELLTGTRPLESKHLMEAGYDEMVRMIREEEPPKPSTRVSTMGERLQAIAKHRQAAPKALGRIFHGDLDWIAMKALEKDRSRRYETASALAEDVRRYLAHLPVEAGRPSASYRLRKYFKRHTVGVTAGSAVLAALLIGLVLAWSGYVEAKDQRDAARESAKEANFQRAGAVAARKSERTARLEAEANEARARTEALKASTVVELLDDMLSSADPHDVKGPKYTLRQLLDDFDVGLGNRLEDQPEVECTLRRTMGSAYLGLGLLDTAERHLVRALDLARGELQEDPDVLAGCLQSWAQVQRDRGRYAEAEGMFREVLELLSWPAEESEEIAGGMNSLGGVVCDLGRYGESERLHRDALAMMRKLFGEEHSFVGPSLNNLALVLSRQGKYAEAESLQRRAVEMGRKQFGDEHPDVATSLGNLAGVLEEQGKYEEAERQCRRALEMRRKLFGDEHRGVATSLGQLAVVRRAQGKYEESELLAREALEMVRKLLGDEHPGVATSLNNLAVVLMIQGGYEEAEGLYREALEMGRKQFGDEHPDVATSLGNLAVVLMIQGGYEEAEKLQREALEMKRKLLGDEHPRVAASLNNLGLVLYRQERYAEAERLHRRAVEMVRKQFGDEHRDVATSLSNLASDLTKLGKHEEAEKLQREALEMKRKVLGDGHPEVAVNLNNLAVALWSQRKSADAESLYREALEMRRKQFRDDDPEVVRSLYGIALILGERGDLVGATQMLLDIDHVLEIGLLQEKSLPWLRPHLRECEESLSGDSVELAQARILLGACLLGQEELEKAADLLLEGYEGLPETPEGAVDQRIQAAAWLVQLFEAMDSPNDAQHFRSVLEELGGEGAR